jgi:hypothetical protein
MNYFKVKLKLSTDEETCTYFAKKIFHTQKEKKIYKTTTNRKLHGILQLHYMLLCNPQLIRM